MIVNWVKNYPTKRGYTNLAGVRDIFLRFLTKRVSLLELDPSPLLPKTGSKERGIILPRIWAFRQIFATNCKLESPINLKQSNQNGFISRIPKCVMFECDTQTGSET